MSMFLMVEYQLPGLGYPSSSIFCSVVGSVLARCLARFLETKWDLRRGSRERKNGADGKMGGFLKTRIWTGIEARFGDPGGRVASVFYGSLSRVFSLFEKVENACLPGDRNFSL